MWLKVHCLVRMVRLAIRQKPKTCARVDPAMVLGLGVFCRMWENRAYMKEVEGCCIERATQSDYINN